MANVLVVDDHPDLARAVVIMLGQPRPRARLETSGPAALQALERSLPDVMLLDVMMPGMDGLEVLKRVRAHPDHAGLRVVMFSASPTRAEEALRMGADRFVLKMDLNHETLPELVEPHADDADRPAPAFGRRG